MNGNGASNNAKNIAYVSLVAAVAVPLAQKHFGITLSIDDIADAMAGLAIAWHGLSTFIDSRWPPKTVPTLTPDAATEVARLVMAELKATYPFAPPQPQPEKPQ